MSNRYCYSSEKTYLITKILSILAGIVLYIAFGALGTIGIAILLLWIVHNYKYEKYDNLYELYDIANKEHIAYIKTKRNLRKGETICCSSIGDWYIEEVNACFTQLYAYAEGKKIITDDEDHTFCLLKCRRIYDLVPEKLLKEEQIEKVSDED